MVEFQADLEALQHEAERWSPSTTHFENLDLGLKVYYSSKCPVLGSKQYHFLID